VTPDDIFNFEAPLFKLMTHDWDLRPCVKIIGRERAGKSKIIEEYARSLLPENLVIHLDSRALTAEDQLVNQAVACADRGELPASRDQLRPISAHIEITGSSIVGSTIQLRQGSRWRRSQQTVPPSRPSLIPTLLADLENAKRLTWIIVDHFNEANPLVLDFVQRIAPRLSRRRGLRLLLVTIEHPPGEGAPTVAGLGSQTMATYRVESLDAEALQKWADELGLTIDRGNADILCSLSDGRAGEAWKLLMKLAVRAQYQSSQHRELTQ
jgi:hypothetical protein